MYAYGQELERERERLKSACDEWTDTAKSNYRNWYSERNRAEAAELRAAQERERAIEECAKVLDAMHEKITDGWETFTEERCDGAHNALTNGAKAIRAIRALAAAKPSGHE